MRWPTTGSPSPPVAALLLSLVVLFSLSGCGDDNDGMRPAPSPTPAAAATGDLPMSTATPTGPTPTVTPTRPSPTPTKTIPPAVRIEIGNAEGSPGEIVTVDVRLVLLLPEIPVAGTQNEIAFDALGRIASNEGKRPACAANPAIRKNGTAFSFQPVGCVPGDSCTAIRSFVLSLSDVDPIPDGSVLYTCRVEVSEAALPGTLLPLRCSIPGASTPEGQAIDGVFCPDGEIRVVGESPDTPTALPPAPSPTPSGPRLPNGTGCASDAECASGVCDEFDGICCEGRCDPVSEFCDPSRGAICERFADERDLGDPCTFGSQCFSGLCVDGVCCSSPECSEGQFCRPGTGACGARLSNGDRCALPEHCASGNCVNGVCCATPACPPGDFCQPDTGECSPGRPPGDRCEADADCRSGNCVDGVCCNVPRCPLGQFCDSGVCAPRLPNGDDCTQYNQCNSGFCVDGVCCATVSCPSGATCQRFTGECQTPLPTRTRTPRRTPIPSLTPTASPIVEIRIARAAGAPGETVSVDVSFAVIGSTIEVGGTQNDIELDALLDVVTRGDGKPDCTANPATRKDAFAAELSCPPGVCCNRRLRVFILSLAGVDPIPDGSVLYTCRVTVSAEAPPGSTIPLRCSMPNASDPGGGRVTASCRDGEISVTGDAPDTPTSAPLLTCSSDEQCASQVCHLGTCCDRRCELDREFCGAGRCRLLEDRQDGDSCSFHPQCASGFCVDGVCCAVPACPSGQFCRERS